MIFYDKEKFAAKKLKVPETIDEFVAAAEKMYDKQTKYAGYVSRGNGIQAVYTLAPFVFGLGGRWLDEKGRPELTSEAFIKALEIYGGTLHKYGPPGIAGATWAQTKPLSAWATRPMNTDSSNFVPPMKTRKNRSWPEKSGMLPFPGAGGHPEQLDRLVPFHRFEIEAERGDLVVHPVAGKQGNEHAPGQDEDSRGPTVGLEQQGIPIVHAKDWLDSFAKSIPTAAVNQANPLVVQVPETRDAIGKAIVAVIQGKCPGRSHESPAGMPENPEDELRMKDPFSNSNRREPCPASPTRPRLIDMGEFRLF